MAGEVEKAIDLADEILDLVDELPERAEEFGDSVREKTVSIKTWIEDRNAVTGNQISALENMLEGVQRWIR